LSKSKEKSQLVKYKDTELYLQLYIFIDNEEDRRKQYLLHEVLIMNLSSLEWNRRSTLVLSNTRELDRDLLTN